MINYYAIGARDALEKFAGKVIQFPAARTAPSAGDVAGPSAAVTPIRPRVTSETTTLPDGHVVERRSTPPARISRSSESKGLRRPGQPVKKAIKKALGPFSVNEDGTPWHASAFAKLDYPRYRELMDAYNAKAKAEGRPLKALLRPPMRVHSPDGAVKRLPQGPSEGASPAMGGLVSKVPGVRTSRRPPLREAGIDIRLPDGRKPTPKFWPELLKRQGVPLPEGKSLLAHLESLDLNKVFPPGFDGYKRGE